MARNIVVVDPRFRHVLADLRRRQRLSYRRLAFLANYSHTPIWEIEAGKKEPTLELAAALDRALGANGELARLVTEHSEPSRDSVDNIALPIRDPVGHDPDMSEVLVALLAMRRRLEGLACKAWRSEGRIDPPDDTDLVVVSQWAQLASWLYDAFVRRRPRLMRLGARRYSRKLRTESGTSPFRAEVSRQGRVPHSECRSISVQSAPPEIAVRLGLERDATIVRRENWYYADGEPLQVGVTYVPTAIAGNSSIARDKALGRGGIYSRFEELGYPIARIREEVFVRLPIPEETACMKIPPGVPVLEVTHTSYDTHHEPFEVTRFIARSDLVGLDYDLPVED